MRTPYRFHLRPLLRAALAGVAVLTTVGTTLLVDGLARHYQAGSLQATRGWPQLAAARSQ